MAANGDLTEYKRLLAEFESQLGIESSGITNPTGRPLDPILYVVNDSEVIPPSDLQSILSEALRSLRMQGASFSSAQMLDKGTYPQLGGIDVLLFVSDNTSNDKMFSGKDYRTEYSDLQKRFGFPYDEDTFEFHTGYINPKTVSAIPVNAASPKEELLGLFLEMITGKTKVIYDKLKAKQGVVDQELSLKTFEMEEGIREVVDSIRSVGRKPVLVAVYGWPDMGKSYLIERLETSLRQNGSRVSGYNGAPGDHTFRGIQRHPADVYLFHCAWLRSGHPMYERTRGYEDPNILAQQFLGRDVDVNVAIHNPKLVSATFADPRQDHFLYDLILLNCRSVRK